MLVEDLNSFLSNFTRVLLSTNIFAVITDFID